MRRTFRFVVLLTGLLLLPTLVYGQTVISKPDPIFGWMQPVTPGDTVLPTSYQFLIQVDAGPEQALTTVTCTAPTAPETRWRCETPVPLLPTGNHTLRVAASVTLSGTTHKTTPSSPLGVISLLIAVPQDLYLRDKDAPPPGGGFQ